MKIAELASLCAQSTVKEGMNRAFPYMEKLWKICQMDIPEFRYGGLMSSTWERRRTAMRQMRDVDGRSIVELARLFKVSPNTFRRA